MSKICKNCGAQVLDEAKFCTGCGGNEFVTETAQTEIASAPAEQVTQPMFNAVIPQEPLTPREPEKKSKKGIIIAIIAIICVAALAVAAIFVVPDILEGKEDDDTEQGDEDKDKDEDEDKTTVEDDGAVAVTTAPHTTAAIEPETTTAPAETTTAPTETTTSAPVSETTAYDPNTGHSEGHGGGVQVPVGGDVYVVEKAGLQIAIPEGFDVEEETDAEMSGITVSSEEKNQMIAIAFMDLGDEMGALMGLMTEDMIMEMLFSELAGDYEMTQTSFNIAGEKYPGAQYIEDGMCATMCFKMTDNGIVTIAVASDSYDTNAELIALISAA